MKVIVGYSRYGIEIDVSKEASKDEMTQAYLRACGGPEDAFNHFLRHVSFIEDTIPDAPIIEESKNIITYFLYNFLCFSKSLFIFAPGKQ